MSGQGTRYFMMWLLRDKVEGKMRRNILTSRNLTGWGHLKSGLSHLAPEKRMKGVC